MRVVLDARTATDHFPGIGRYVVSLAAALARVAPELDLALLYDPRAPATRLALPDLPRLACPVSPFAPQQQWAVPRRLAATGAGVYHSPYYLMPYRSGLPAVLTVYDLIPLVCPEYYRPVQRLIYRVAHGLALRSACSVIAISEATRRDLARYFRLDPARVTVTPLAADARFVPQPAPVVQAARQRYGLPERYVLFLASNKPHKNLAGLVASWPAVVRRHPGARLVVAGHWDERFPAARRLTEEFGLQDSVCFAGPIAEADLPAVYSGAAVFVFPSFYEGFGLPVLEAMACGAPVVCSNTSSLPEVAGAAAHLVDPHDTVALAEAISTVLADEDAAAALRRRGLNQAAEFTWEATALATWAVYRRAAGQPHPSTSHEAHA